MRRIILFLLFFAICLTGEENLSKIYTDAKTFYKQKNYSRAIPLFEKIIKKSTLSSYGKESYILLGKIYSEEGKFKEAAEIYNQLLEFYPSLLDEYTSDTKIHPYQRARMKVDWRNFEVETMVKISSLYEKTSGENTSRIWEKIVYQYPLSPYSITASFKLGRYFEEKGKISESIPYYIKSIASSTREKAKYKAYKRENQKYIDQINKERLTPEQMAETIFHLQQLILKKEKSRERKVFRKADESIKGEIKQAQIYVEKGKYEGAIKKYTELETKFYKTVYSELFTLLKCICLNREGRNLQVIRQINEVLYPEFSENKFKLAERYFLSNSPSHIYFSTLKKYLLYIKAKSEKDAGFYEDAEKTLKKLIKEVKKTDILYPETLFLFGKINEYQGKLKEAIRWYKKTSQTEAKEIKDESEYAIKRIREIKEQFKYLKENNKAIYIGEDRITKGRWIGNYGNYFYILCGMGGYKNLFSWSFKGGKAWTKFVEYEKTSTGVRENWKYKVYTGNPEDGVRGWVTKLEDDLPVFLTHPYRKKPRPANWDDHGEVYPVGKGPDLYLDLPIPEKGEFSVSLYFVNDPYFYEPNRKYTIYVIDKRERAILTATDVEDFINGVYKKFIVKGPSLITFRIYRNLSLNTLLSGVFIDRLQDKKN